eukprot:CAMPEP_0183431040 /NCGR_PEP_ID=MMETSP0370-20130417/54546_1 /TAXON_ID=268820 /ORGANISM="Peridinium aciculiferum, Strain PAER-2" /LENGTH=243 /DNA_ID=CAMNT_0025616601 /DNA_START=54 /DNA_END=785 /DNA_ORIENTATION=+
MARMGSRCVGASRSVGRALRCYLVAAWALLFVACPTSFVGSGLARRSRVPSPLHHCVDSRTALYAGDRPEQQRPLEVQPAGQPVCRWRVWAATGLSVAIALLRPMPVWARAARKYATRAQESQAQYITVGILVLFFVCAFFNSKKEDSSEEERIKGEVARLVRLKKEFEEQESNEDTSDDTMAAALRAAQEKMSKEKAAEEAAAAEAAAAEAEGKEGDTDEKPDGDAPDDKKPEGDAGKDPKK